jgi:hypothetical protein
MTTHRNFKRRVRARAAETGVSYTAALRHFRPTATGDDMPQTSQTTLRIAVAQSTVHEDPTSIALLRESGAEARRLMKQAADAGARLIHFTEGAISFPQQARDVSARTRRDRSLRLEQGPVDRAEGGA